MKKTTTIDSTTGKFRKSKFVIPENDQVIDPPFSPKTKTPPYKKALLLVAIIGVALSALFYFKFKGVVVAATVNGSPITRLSIVQELEKQGGKSVLESVITEKLIEGEAKKKGVTVSEDEVNQEMKTIEENVTKQGGTLVAALAQQGMTLESLKAQMKTQKMVEKILADKTQVTDEEVTAFLTANKMPTEEGQEAPSKDQIKKQLTQQKFQKEAQAWVESLKKDAKINYYVNY